LNNLKPEARVWKGIRGWFGQPLFDCLGTKVFKIEKEEFSELSPERVVTIEKGAIGVASLGFAREKTPEFILDVKQHLRAGRLYCCFDQTGEMVAFRIIEIPRHDIVYLAGAVKTPLSPRHLIRELTGKILKESNPDYVVTRTQNPHVVDMLLDLCTAVIPLDRLPEADEIEAVTTCGINCTDERLITPKHYGSSMIGAREKPESKNPRVKNFMDEIDYFDGDARILVGRGIK